MDMVRLEIRVPREMAALIRRRAKKEKRTLGEVAVLLLEDTWEEWEECNRRAAAYELRRLCGAP